MVILAENVEKAKEKLCMLSISDSVFVIKNEKALAEEIHTGKSVLISRNESLKKQCREQYGCFCFDSSLIAPLIDWRG